MADKELHYNPENKIVCYLGWKQSLICIILHHVRLNHIILYLFFISKMSPSYSQAVWLFSMFSLLCNRECNTFWKNEKERTL